MIGTRTGAWATMSRDMNTPATTWTILSRPTALTVQSAHRSIRLATV
jgi:hypothetical protein